MTRLLLAYLAGVLSVTAAVFAAAGRPSAITFAIGVFVTVAAGVAALSSTARARRAARFLSAVADALEASAGGRRPGRPELVTPAESEHEADIVSALVNLGAKKAAARAAARQAITENKDADFGELLHAAVALSTGKAAA